MEKDIDIEDTIKNLKNYKSPGVTGFTNELYKEFHNNLNIWTLNCNKFTKEQNTLSYMQERGSKTLIPKGQKVKKELGNWRPITLQNALYRQIFSILAKKSKKFFQE